MSQSLEEAFLGCCELLDEWVGDAYLSFVSNLIPKLDVMIGIICPPFHGSLTI